MSDFSGTANLLGPIATGIVSVLVAYLIPALFFLVVCLAFVQCIFQRRGCWQVFMGAGFVAFGVAYLNYLGNCDEVCDYMMAAAMIFVSFSVIISVRKHSGTQ